MHGVARRELDVRKASFAAVADAVAATGMEYGGITPVGLPGDWPVLVDAQVGRHAPGGGGQRRPPLQAGRRWPDVAGPRPVSRLIRRAM